MSHCVTLSVLLSLSVVLEGREYSYTYIDTHDINVMLNSHDVSEYLKISPDGMEVNISFEFI